MSLLMIDQLLKKGVIIPVPGSVMVAPDIRPEHIAEDVVLHPGCRIEGAHTAIGAGSVIGREGPAVVSNCQVGKKVHLGAGFFDSSVFLDRASMGGGAHVRPGCLIEEQAGGAHTVGLKQTVLMSYVTLGSLINFCDCLMAGGTSRKNHSEVGSSYIHFNFTPHQDKATPSLIGDVPRGVLLNQPPIFLGGQGGLVGPVRIAFGTVAPAGQIVRKDILEPGHCVTPERPPSGVKAYPPLAYGRMDRLVFNNLNYIGNIKALRGWYRLVRKPFAADAIALACHQGALRVLDQIIEERIKRLGELAEKLPESLVILADQVDERSNEAKRQQRRFVDEWSRIKEHLKARDEESLHTADGRHELRADAEAAVRAPSFDYLKWVAGLDETARAAATAWLDAVVRDTTGLWSS